MNAIHPPTNVADERDDEFYQARVADIRLAAYNRVISDYHVESLMLAYKDRPWAVPAIECNMREDGSLVVINGQHRTEMARRLGWATIRAVVHFGWSLEQEAQAFRDSARGKAINTLDQWWAAGLAGEPEVAAINRVLADLGLYVPRRFGDSHKPDTVACPAALVAISYGRVRGQNRREGTFTPERVDMVLRFVLATWPEDPMRFDGRFLRMLGAWFRKYQDNPAFSLKEAQRKLSVYDVTDIIRRVRGAAHSDSTDIVTAGGRVLTGLYDKARRGVRLMPIDQEGEGS